MIQPHIMIAVFLSCQKPVVSHLKLMIHIFICSRFHCAYSREIILDLAVNLRYFFPVLFKCQLHALIAYIRKNKHKRHQRKRCRYQIWIYRK